MYISNNTYMIIVIFLHKYIYIITCNICVIIEERSEVVLTFELQDVEKNEVLEGDHFDVESFGT